MPPLSSLSRVASNYISTIEQVLQVSTCLCVNPHKYAPSEDVFGESSSSSRHLRPKQTRVPPTTKAEVAPPHPPTRPRALLRVPPHRRPALPQRQPSGRGGGLLRPPSAPRGGRARHPPLHPHPRPLRAHARGPPSFPVPPRPGPHLEVGAQAARAPRLVGDLVGAGHQQVLVDLLAEALTGVDGQVEGDGENRTGAEQER